MKMFCFFLPWNQKWMPYRHRCLGPGQSVDRVKRESLLGWKCDNSNRFTSATIAYRLTRCRECLKKTAEKHLVEFGCGFSQNSNFPMNWVQYYCFTCSMKIETIKTVIVEKKIRRLWNWYEMFVFKTILRLSQNAALQKHRTIRISRMFQIAGEMRMHIFKWCFWAHLLSSANPCTEAMCTAGKVILWMKWRHSLELGNQFRFTYYDGKSPDAQRHRKSLKNADTHTNSRTEANANSALL